LYNKLVHRPVQQGAELMRVADPSKEWELELHMAENRMGYIAEQQQKKYDEARKTVQEMIRKQIPLKMPDAPEEEVQKAVEQELDDVSKLPDSRLQDKWDSLMRDKYQSQLNEIVKDLPEGSVKSKLTEIAAAKTYGEAKKKLQDILDEDAEAKARFLSQLGEIVKDLPDGEEKTRLSEIAAAPSCGEARKRLQEALPQLTAETQEPFAKLFADFPADSLDDALKESLGKLPAESLDLKLKVSFILATEPGKTREGTVEEIESSAEVRGEEGNTVMIKVSIDKKDFKKSDLQPGATVTAKVACGRRPLGFVLLHDLIAFLQARVFFRYF
jgi:hypothetical protein